MDQLQSKCIEQLPSGSHAASPQQQRRRTRNTILVIGGTGFVGTAMCEAGIHHGLRVISISRTGAMPYWLRQPQTTYESMFTKNSNENYENAWATQVEWCKGNAAKPETLIKYFENTNANANGNGNENVRENDNNGRMNRNNGDSSTEEIVGVISCVGGFHYKQAMMEKICGDYNINICKLATQYKIPKFVFVSRDKTNLKDWWYIFPYVIPGYYKGKHKAEQYIVEQYGRPSDNKKSGGDGFLVVEDDANQAHMQLTAHPRSQSAICLLSGFVTGTRYLLGWIPIPLYLLCNLVQYICPIIHRKQLACTAIRFILSETDNEKLKQQILIPNKDIATAFLDNSRGNTTLS